MKAQQWMGHQFEWEAGQEGLGVLTLSEEVHGVFHSMCQFTSKTQVKQTVQIMIPRLLC